jgi:small subunit ribosomal protein S19
MGRSLKKGPWIEPRLQRKVDKALTEDNRNPIKTWARASTITPDYVGMTFMVHNGRQFIKVFVTEDMVGHRMGEFSPTRTFRGHDKKK